MNPIDPLQDPPMCPRCFASNERACAAAPCSNCGFPGELSTKLPPTMAEQLHAAPRNKTTGEVQFVEMMRACAKAGVSLVFMRDAVLKEIASSLPATKSAATKPTKTSKRK